MTALVAAGALESYSAELASLMGFHGGFKPLIVRSDQGSAFVSFHFREFLSARQIHQSLACTYTPQQAAEARHRDDRAPTRCRWSYSLPSWL